MLTSPSTPWRKILLFSLLAGLPASAASAVDAWSQCEITLETGANYAYPYTAVSVSATFVGPETKTVRGFLYETFAPNPQGTRIRGRFKIRFTPTLTGSYTFTTTSTDGGLVVSTPTDVTPYCISPGPGGAHGFLRADPAAANRYSFVWDDGVRFFMWGQTYYQAVQNARYELALPPGWKTAIDNTSFRRMNKVRLLIAPWGVYRDPADPSRVLETQPFCRQPETPTGPTNCFRLNTAILDQLDHDQLDLDHWKALDAVVQYLYGKGMAAEIVVFRDGTDNAFGPNATFGTLDQDRLYLDHAIARYGAYPHVIWSLSNEWQSAERENGAHNFAYWNTIGNCLRSGCTTSAGRAIGPDPWVTRTGGGSTFRRALTIHPGAQPLPGTMTPEGHCFSFFSQAWPAHASLQEHYANVNCSGFQGDVMGYNSIAANRRSESGTCAPTSGKSLPVVNDEYGYLGLDPGGPSGGCAAQTAEQHRNVMWGIATAGGFGTAGDARCDCPHATNGCNSQSACSTPPIQSSLWRSSASWTDVQRLVEFFTSTTRAIPYWTMSGQDPYPDGDRVHTLADAGRNTVVSYFAVRVPATLGLPQGTYRTVWYNPRSGAETAVTCTVVAASQPSFLPPDATGDWVLWLRRNPVCP